MRYVFVTGMGRSGTKFLTVVLKGIKNIHAEHEYIGNREFTLLSWYLPGNVYAESYLIRSKKEIEKKFTPGLFIDINGMLQNCVPSLEKIFMPEKIFHFVRDPRAVVRSMYSRRNDKDIHLIPKTREEVEKWMDHDKFSQICWNWANTTENLLAQNTTLIRFENITQDYSYLKEKILEPLQLNLSEEQWDKLKAKKVNKTQSRFYRKIYSKVKGKPFIEEEIPEYDKWPPAYKKQLKEICEAAMKKCGYEI